MHRTDVKDDQGKLWYVFHNGDWSGEAMLRPADAKEDVPDIKLPGFVIKNACKQAIATELFGVIETAMDKYTGSER